MDGVGKYLGVFVGGFGRVFGGVFSKLLEVIQLINCYIKTYNFLILSYIVFIFSFFFRGGGGSGGDRTDGTDHTLL